MFLSVQILTAKWLFACILYAILYAILLVAVITALQYSGGHSLRSLSLHVYIFCSFSIEDEKKKERKIIRFKL